MSWIFFLVWLFFFCWLLCIGSFFRKSGLSRLVLVGLFIIKIIAGIGFFQFYSLPSNKPTSDTWKFYDRSRPETDLLLSDPGAFVKDLFTTSYSSTGELFSDQNSYWNDVKDNVMVKLMAVVNVFTLKNYYANIIWFNFVFFIGLVAFYRLLHQLFPYKKNLLAAVVFLLPSFLFWCSGIHKDGLIFSLIGIILFCFQRVIERRRIISGLLIILFCLATIFFLRSYIVLVMLPCLLIGYIANLLPQKKMLVVAVSLFAGVLLMFTGRYLHPSLNVPSYIAEKQSQFKRLSGNSEIQTKQLEPTFSSFVNGLPTAFDIGFLRPHISEQSSMSKIASLEIIVFWLTFFFCLISLKRISPPPVVIVCWLFAFIVLLIIGYTVNFSGAVVRYRSLVMPLLLAPAAGMLFSYIKKKNM